jgi:hypothetical protein
MAKVSRYTEEQLLNAVVLYANLHPGKIEATKLAQWASQNVAGLEGVNHRHFTRTEEKKDPKTGKITTRIRSCTTKINELNAARSTVSAMNSNSLLRSSNIDKFFSLPVHEQRKLILDTRKQVDMLISENSYLRSDNKIAQEKNRKSSELTEALENELGALKKDHEKLLALVSRAMDSLDKTKRKTMLESIGVCDGWFDLDTYADSLTVRIDEVEAMNAVIKKDRTGNDVGLNRVGANELMEGIDFD